MTGAGEADAWYALAFRDDYRRVYAHRDLTAARAEAAWLVEVGLEGRVLDLCCGFARHTLALAERGLDVFGLDLSMDLLRAAPELPGYAERLEGRLVRGDARFLPYREGSFDGVALLFSSFGYFGEEGDAAVLAGIARVLREGGVAFLDLMNPARVRAGLVPESEKSVSGLRIVERRRLEDGGRRVVKDVELHDAEGGVRTWTEDVRMYEEDEVRERLAAVGLRAEALAGDFGGDLADGPVAAGAPRMIVRARKRR